MRSLFVAVLAVLAPLFVSACSSNTSPAAMTVVSWSHPTPNPKLAGAVAVGTVSGGEETNPLWMSKVDNGSFRQALTDSLRANGYLSAASTAPYTLDAALVSLDQPFIGFEFDVDSTVNYTFRGDGVEKAYPITATGTASMSDAFLAVERLKMANERSIRENITRLLSELQKF